MPNGVHNGNLCKGAKRARIIERLAQGQSITQIALDMRMSPRTVKAVGLAEWHQVSDRKNLLANQFEAIANMANHRILGELQTAKRIPLAVVNVVAGVATDKVIALRGDNVSTVRHVHSIDINDEDLVAFAVQRSKRPRVVRAATVIDVQPKALNVPEDPPASADHPVNDPEAFTADQPVGSIAQANPSTPKGGRGRRRRPR